MTTLTLVLFLLAAPREQLDGLETIHGHVGNVQTILTRPIGAKAPLPAVMLVPWLSCDGIEIQAGPLDGMNELSKRIAMQSGLVYCRVEKPAPCRDTDFQTELAAYRAAFASLREHPWVDRDRIVLIGMSNGGGVLPLVSNGAPIAGYIVVNGWSKTWFEHMMEMLRRGPEMRGKKPGEVSAAMSGYAELYAGYLIEKKTPAEVVRSKPRLKSLWDDEPAHQYGRPSAFFHQLQELNLAEAWSKVAEPALVVWGDADWIMSRDDHERIVAMVNRNKPGAARLLVIPKMTHFVAVDERFPEPLATSVLDWIREVVRSRTF